MAPNVVNAAKDGRGYRWIVRGFEMGKNTLTDIVKRRKIPALPKSTIRKICPVVLRQNTQNLEFLAFKHPKAGNQFVKGTIENGETDQAAAKRELFEESGISTNAEFIAIGSSPNIAPNQEWTFLHITLTDLPDIWRFQTKDDGGLEFSFFWIPVHKKLTNGWHETFVRAHEFISRHIQGT